MNDHQQELKTLLKKRLCAAISAQIDMIGYVPQDISRLIGAFNFNADMMGPIPEDLAYVRDEKNDDLEVDSEHERKNNLAYSVNQYYDEAFYNDNGIMGLLLGDSEYRNIGYWDATTHNQHEASERLQDKLLEFIPEKTGTILDVACGMGASTKRLLNHYPAENVWAINISAKQIETVKKNAPGSHALVMNAVDMQFDNDFFDNILCIEAAFHFETREKFLQDAYRILKPEGRLVLSDTLFTSKERLAQHAVFPSPDNHIETVSEYENLLKTVGFRNIEVIDASLPIWGEHFIHTIKHIHEAFYKGKLNIIQLTEILWTYYYLNSITGLCVLVSAQK